jgi:hypothetical protein
MDLGTVGFSSIIASEISLDTLGTHTLWLKSSRLKENYRSFEGIYLKSINNNRNM